MEQIVRTIRKDKAPIIEISIQKGENGQPLIGMTEKRRLSEVGVDKDGNRQSYIQGFINGITEIKSNATRNAILKNMSEENIRKYQKGEEIKIALVYNPSRGMVADLLESFTGKVFDGSWSSLWLSTGISRGSALAISSGDKRVKYDLGLYSQGNIVGLGAFNVLKNNGIHLGKGKGFDLRSYGTPIRRNTLSDFEKTLGIRFKGSALNTPDFVANTNKLFSLSGESRLVNISNIDKVKEHSWKDRTGHLPIGKAALREQLMPGLFIPVLPDSKKIGKPDYLHSNIINKKELRLIGNNYKSAYKIGLTELTSKEISSLISNPHGTYVYESAIISEEIYNKFKEYRTANVIRKNKILGEVKDLYNLDQSLKINLTINGPALLDKSPYLLEAKDKYNKEELLKDYTNGKYTDKGLSNSPKLNTNVFPYERKENTGVSDINSYLRNLRIGVER